MPCASLSLRCQTITTKHSLNIMKNASSSHPRSPRAAARSDLTARSCQSRSTVGQRASLSVRFLHWGGVCLSVALSTMAYGQTPPVAIPANGWKVPVDVSNSGSPSRADWLNLGWDTFVALSWPAQSKGQPGQPNRKVSITDPQSASGPSVWSTYLAKEQTFLPKAADPGSWTKPTSVPATQDGLPILDGFSKTGPDADGEFDEAFSDAPLIDMQKNFVLYEIRLNQAEFTYVDVNQYYDADKQKASFKTVSISFVGFPKTGLDITDPTTKKPVKLPPWAQQGALEVKASWRILTGADDPTRYYTQKSYYQTPDGKVQGPATLGLVGLHILRLTPTTGSTWYWATFEQVDNLGESGHAASFSSPNPPLPNAGGYSYEPAAIEAGKPLPADPTPVNVKRVYPIPADVQAANSAYQAALKGTVWQYYQLIDVQNPVPAGTPGAAPVPLNTTAFANTDHLANATMETYEQLQGGMGPGPQSCVNCHGQYGFPQGAPKTPDYQVFTFLLGDATSASTGAKKPKK